MSELINQTDLAAALNKRKEFVTMMKRAGYRMQYEAAGRTTLEHALAALQRAPEFRAGHYEKKGWKYLPKLLAEPTSPAASASGKSY